MLLAGVVPFDDTSERKLVAKILRGAYPMSGPEWGGVSAAAKRLLSGLMCLDPGRRLTAPQALALPWFSQQGGGGGAAAAAAARAPLPAVSSGRLAAYAARARPPVRTFAPGDYLVRKGQRSAEVFLIRAGRAAVLSDDAPDAPGGADGSATGVAPGLLASVTLPPTDPPLGSPLPTSPPGLPAFPPRPEWVVCERGPGEFVGSTDHELLLSSPSHPSASAPRPPSPPPRPATAPAGGAPPPGATDEAAGAPLPPAFFPLKGWSTALAAHKAARRWVGKRRAASVVALTRVDAVALRRAHMARAEPTHTLIASCLY